MASEEGSVCEKDKPSSSATVFDFYTEVNMKNDCLAIHEILVPGIQGMDTISMIRSRMTQWLMHWLLEL